MYVIIIIIIIIIISSSSSSSSSSSYCCHPCHHGHHHRHNNSSSCVERRDCYYQKSAKRNTQIYMTVYVKAKRISQGSLSSFLLSFKENPLNLLSICLTFNFKGPQH